MDFDPEAYIDRIGLNGSLRPTEENFASLHRTNAIRTKLKLIASNDWKADSITQGSISLVCDPGNRLSVESGDPLIPITPETAVIAPNDNTIQMIN